MSLSQEKIKSVIIDDDEFIRELLKDKIAHFVPEIELAGMASSGMEGIKLIETLQPDLIFLDVEMADMTGFEMLSQISNINFQVIFITSYSHYAIKAIRFNALDYLLKPIDLGELKKAMDRYIEKQDFPEPVEHMKRALKNITEPNQADKELALLTQEGTVYIRLQDIIRIEGERNYSYIYLMNDKKKLFSKTVSDFEELLDDKGFFRCHKSHLIHRDHIESHNRIMIKMKDGTSIPIARRRTKDFQDWMDQH